MSIKKEWKKIPTSVEELSEEMEECDMLTEEEEDLILKLRTEAVKVLKEIKEQMSDEDEYEEIIRIIMDNLVMAEQIHEMEEEKKK